VFVLKSTSGGFGEGGDEERWSGVAGSHVRHMFDVRLETDVLSYYPLPLRKKESRVSRTAWPPKYPYPVEHKGRKRGRRNTDTGYKGATVA